MEDLFAVDPDVLRRLETGRILKHDLLALKRQLKLVDRSLCPIRRSDSSPKHDENILVTANNCKQHLEPFVHRLLKSLNTCFLNHCSSQSSDQPTGQSSGHLNLHFTKLTRLFRSVLDQLVRILLLSGTEGSLAKLDGPEWSGNLAFLYLLYELKRVKNSQKKSSDTSTTSYLGHLTPSQLVREAINDKLPVHVLLLFEPFFQGLASEDYACFRDDMVRKLKRSSTTVLGAMVVLFRSLGHSGSLGTVVDNLFELLVLLCGYQFDPAVYELLEVVSIGLSGSLSQDSACLKCLVETVDQLLARISATTNRDETEKLSVVLSCILYSPYEASTSALAMYNKFFKANLASTAGGQSTSAHWTAVVDKHIALIDRNCNNKLFSKVQVNFINFTSSLYLLSRDDRLLSILVKLFNSIGSVGDSHVNCVMKATIAVFFDPLSCSKDWNSADGFSKLDLGVINKVYNAVVDKRIYKQTLIQVLYLAIRLNGCKSDKSPANKLTVDLNAVTKLDTDGLDFYYSLLSFHCCYHLLLSSGSSNGGLVSSGGAIDIASFVNSYVKHTLNSSLPDELQPYFTLLQMYNRLAYFTHLIAEVNALVGSLDLEHVVNLFLVVAIKRLFNKSLLLHLYSLFSATISGNANLSMLCAFVMSSPSVDRYDYVGLKREFPRLFRTISDSISSCVGLPAVSDASDNCVANRHTNKLELTRLLYGHNVNLSFLLTFKEIDSVLPFLIESLLSNYRKYLRINLTNVTELTSSENGSSNSSTMLNAMFDNILPDTEDQATLYDVYGNVEVNEREILKNKNVTRSELDSIIAYRKYLVYRERLSILNQLVNIYNVLYNYFYRLYSPANNTQSNHNTHNEPPNSTISTHGVSNTLSKISHHLFKLLFYAVLKLNNVKLFGYFNSILLRSMFNLVFGKHSSAALVFHLYPSDDGEKVETSTLLALLCQNVDEKYLFEGFSVIDYLVHQLVSTTSAGFASGLEINRIYDALLVMLRNRYPFDSNLFKYLYYLHQRGKDCSELLRSLEYLVTTSNLVYLFHLYLLTNMNVVLEVMRSFCTATNVSDCLKPGYISSQQLVSQADMDGLSELKTLEHEIGETGLFQREFGMVARVKLSTYLSLFQVAGTNDRLSNNEAEIVELFRLYMVELPSINTTISGVNSANMKIFSSYYRRHYDALSFLDLFSVYIEGFSDKAPFYELFNHAIGLPFPTESPTGFGSVMDDSIQLPSNSRVQLDVVLLRLVDKFCYVGYYHDLLRSVRVLIESFTGATLDGSNSTKAFYSGVSGVSDGDRLNGLVGQLAERYLGLLPKFNIEDTGANKDTDVLMVLLIATAFVNTKASQLRTLNTPSSQVSEFNGGTPVSSSRSDSSVGSPKWTAENLLKIIPTNADGILINEARDVLLALFSFTKVSTSYVTEQLNLYYNYALSESRYSSVFLALLSMADGCLGPSPGATTGSGVVDRVLAGGTPTRRGRYGDAYRHHFVTKLVGLNAALSQHHYEQHLESLVSSLISGSANGPDSSFEDPGGVVLLESVVVQYGNELSNLYEIIYTMSKNPAYVNSLPRIIGSLLTNCGAADHVGAGSTEDRHDSAVLDNLARNRAQWLVYANFTTIYNIVVTNLLPDGISGSFGATHSLSFGSFGSGGTPTSAKTNKNAILYYNLYLLNFLVSKFSHLFLGLSPKPSAAPPYKSELSASHFGGHGSSSQLSVPDTALMQLLNVVNEYVININSKLKGLTVCVINSFVALLTADSVFYAQKASLVSALTVPNDSNLVSLVEKVSSSCSSKQTAESSSLNAAPADTTSLECAHYGAMSSMKLDVTILNFLVSKCVKVSKLKPKLVLIANHLLSTIQSLFSLRYYVDNVLYPLLHLIYDPIQEVYNSILDLVTLFSSQYTLITSLTASNSVDTFNSAIASDKATAGSVSSDEFVGGANSALSDSSYGLKSDQATNDLLYSLFGKLKYELVRGERFQSTVFSVFPGTAPMGANKPPLPKVEANERLLVCNLISNLLIHLSPEYKFTIVNEFYEYIYGYVYGCQPGSGLNISSLDSLTESESDQLVCYLSMFVYLPHSCYQLVYSNINSLLALLTRLFDYGHLNELLSHVFTSLVLVNNALISMPVDPPIATDKPNGTSSDPEQVNRLIVYYLLYRLYPSCSVSGGSYESGAGSLDGSFSQATLGSDDSSDRRGSYDSTTNTNHSDSATLNHTDGFDQDEVDQAELKLSLLKLLYLFINPPFVLTSDYPLNHLFLGCPEGSSSKSASQSAIATNPAKHTSAHSLNTYQKLIWSYIYLNKFDQDSAVNLNITRFIKLHNIQYILSTIVETLTAVIFDNLFYNSLDNKVVAASCLGFMLERYPAHSASVLDRLLSPTATGDSADDQVSVPNNTTGLGDDNEYCILHILEFVGNSSPSTQLVLTAHAFSDSGHFSTTKRPSILTAVTSRDSVFLGSCLGIHTYYSATNELSKLKQTDNSRGDFQQSVENSLQSDTDPLDSPRDKLDQVVLFLTKCLRYKKCCKYALEALSLISSHYSNVLVGTIIPSFLGVFSCDGADADSTASPLSAQSPGSSVGASIPSGTISDAVLSVYYLVSYNNEYFDQVFSQLLDTYHSNLEFIDDSGDTDTGVYVVFYKNEMILDLLLRLSGINGGELVLDNKDAFFQIIWILSSLFSSNTGSPVASENKPDYSDMLDRFVHSIHSDHVYKLIYLLVKQILEVLTSSPADSEDEDSDQEPLGIYFEILQKLMDNKMVVTNFLQEYLTFILHLTTLPSDRTLATFTTTAHPGPEMSVQSYANLLFNKLVSINSTKVSAVIETVHDYLFTGAVIASAPAGHSVTSKSVWTSVIELCVTYLNNNASPALIKSPIELLLMLSDRGPAPFAPSCLKLFGILIRLINASSTEKGTTASNNRARENRLNLVKLLNNLLSIDSKNYHQITSQLTSTLVKTTLDSYLSRQSTAAVLKLLRHLPNKTSSTITQLLTATRRDLEDKRVVIGSVLGLISNILSEEDLRNEMLMVDPDLLMPYLVSSNNELSVQIVAEMSALSSGSQDTKRRLSESLLTILETKLNSLNDVDVNMLLELVDLDLISNSKFNDFTGQLAKSTSMAHQSYYAQVVVQAVETSKISDKKTFDALYGLMEQVNPKNERYANQIMKSCDTLAKSQYASEDQKSVLSNLMNSLGRT